MRMSVARSGGAVRFGGGAPGGGGAPRGPQADRRAARRRGTTGLFNALEFW